MTVSFTYTATGKRHTMSDASGQTSYIYDSMDRLTSKQTPEGTLTYKLKHRQIGIEHLLLGLLRLNRSDAASLLVAKDLTLRDARSIISSETSQVPLHQKGKRLWRSVASRISDKPDEEAILLREIAKLIAAGKSRKALKRIDEFIAKPGGDKADRIRRFAPHGAAIARATGDLSLARKYEEGYLGETSEGPAYLYNMADVLDLLGEHEEAWKYALRCYRMVTTTKDRLDKGFIELIEKRFPDLAG